MTATPPIVDRETWQKQTDTQRVREKAHTREETRLPRLAGGSRWSRSTRRRRWSAPPTRSRSPTPSSSRSQQFALGPIGGSPCDTLK
jgi:predicted nucleic acid-binding Zn ribbon protein